jgi:glycyl-tRNA synthetase alpha subunit
MSGSDEFYYQGQGDDRLRTEEEEYFTYLLPRLVEHLREINAELLYALERIMTYASIGASVTDVDTSEQPEFVNARAAIKRAKGE